MHTRRGFTVIEILVGILLIAIMSAAVIPALMGRVRDAQTSALGQSLFSLSQAIFEYRKNVTAYPQSLVQLAARPSPTDNDLCGNDLLNRRNNWRGPYISRELIAGGVGIGDAQIKDTLRYSTVLPSITPTTLYIDVGMVETQVATDLEAQFDGANANPATGTIRYTSAPVGVLPAAAAGTQNLSYAIPISGC